MIRGARVTIVSDAWLPQVNGVVTTLRHTSAELEARGADVDIIGPSRFRSIPCPGYAEIALALAPRAALARLLGALAPDFVHVATEGPLGWAARSICRERGWQFTSAFHTRFPEYVKARLGLGLRTTWSLLKRFHTASHGVMVATRTLEQTLRAQGFAHLRRWSRGVDTRAFTPTTKRVAPWPRPVFLSVGRLAIEKNLDAFLSLELPGSKVVVGDGPYGETLRRRYPHAHFLGALHGERLRDAFAQADVFVFPSRTDTFGLVLLEAMACGVPVAAFPVPGPMDVVDHEASGILDEDLKRACLAAANLDRARVRHCAERFSWQAATDQFVANLVAVR